MTLEAGQHTLYVGLLDPAAQELRLPGYARHAAQFTSDGNTLVNSTPVDFGLMTYNARVSSVGFSYTADGPFLGTPLVYDEGGRNPIVAFTLDRIVFAPGTLVLREDDYGRTLESR